MMGLRGTNTRNGVMIALCASLCAFLILLTQHAGAQDGQFSIQVSPAPLVETLQPGTTKTIELTVRNTGTQTEQLKIEPKSFTFGADEQVSLDDTKRPILADWIIFSDPAFTVKPGESFIQKITVATPADAGFSYSMVLLISRKSNPKPAPGAQNIQASVAVFSLFNIDRPGAVREVDLATFISERRVYEYLPATFTVRLKNKGNTFVQPYGNIYIQRHSDDAEPLSVIPVNTSNGYVLPETTRTFTSTWDSGFPVVKTIKLADNAKSEQKTEWDWSKITDLRIGRYTAKLVAVYNDGQRDTPITSEVTFWVFPWKILLGLLVISIILLTGVWAIIRRPVKALRKRHKRKQASHDETKTES